MIFFFFLFLSACSIPNEEIPISVEIEERVRFFAQEWENQGKVVLFDLHYFSKNRCVTEKGLKVQDFPLSISIQKKIQSPILLENQEAFVPAGAIYPYDLAFQKENKRGEKLLILDFESGWLARVLWDCVDSPLIEGINIPKLKASYKKMIATASVPSPLFFDSSRFKKDLSENNINSRSLRLKEGLFWECDIDLSEEENWIFCDPQIQWKDLRRKNKKGEWGYLLPQGFSFFVDIKRGKKWMFFCDAEKKPAVTESVDRF